MDTRKYLGKTLGFRFGLYHIGANRDQVSLITTARLDRKASHQSDEQFTNDIHIVPIPSSWLSRASWI